MVNWNQLQDEVQGLKLDEEKSRKLAKKVRVIKASGECGKITQMSWGGERRKSIEAGHTMLRWVT